LLHAEVVDSVIYMRERCSLQILAFSVALPSCLRFIDGVLDLLHVLGDLSLVGALGGVLVLGGEAVIDVLLGGLVEEHAARVASGLLGGLQRVLLLLLEAVIGGLLVAAQLHEVLLLRHLRLACVLLLRAVLRRRAGGFALLGRHAELLEVVHARRLLHRAWLRRRVAVAARVHHALVVLRSVHVVLLFVLHDHLREHRSEVLALVPLLPVSALTLRLFFILLPLIHLLLEVGCVLLLEVVLVSVLLLESGQRAR